MSLEMKRSPACGKLGSMYLRWTRATAIAVSVAAVTLVFAGSSAAFAAPTPAAADVQGAEAIVQPSVVFIQTQWTGWLTDAMVGDTDAAALLSGDSTTAPKFTVTTTCSGFIANPDGYVITAGHCVDDQSMRYGGKGLIINAAIAELTSHGNWSASEVADLRNYAYQNWTVEGTDKGSPPDRVVGVFPTVAVSGIPVTTPLRANVISVRSFDKGDVALLKTNSQMPMPALAVAPGPTPSDGTQVVAVGYPGSVTENVDPSTEPSMKDGRVSGEQNVNGVPFTEISAATSAGMSGGPAVDMQGRVVGTVSWTPGNETQEFNFITDTSTIRDIPASNGVNNRLSQTDQAYRAGLADYFAGKYHAAVKEFDKVLAMEPDHALALKYKRLAITNYPKEPVTAPKKTSGSNTLLFVLIGAGVLVLALAGTAAVVIRKRRRGGAAGAKLPPGTPGGAPAEQNVRPTAPAAESTQPTAAPPSYEAAIPRQVTEPTAAGRVAGEDTAPVQADRFCPYCGKPHEADAHFCASCGFHFPPTATHREGSAS